MHTLRNVFIIFVGVVLATALVFGLIALGKVVFTPHNPVVVNTNSSVDYGSESPVSVSCVQRMKPGDSADVFTETWDSETRVWVFKNGGSCEGPYCFSYDACKNPVVTLTRQPFWTGHELNPVNGQPFEICYDFEGDCAR